MQRNENRLFPLTKWRLGDNTVLGLIHCLNPIVSFDLFMDNYFTSFRLFVCLPTLSNNIQARGVFHKNRVTQIHYHRGQTAAKKERGHSEELSAHQTKMLRNLCGWLEQQQGALQSFF